MPRNLHDGRDDGLQPLESLDIRQVDGLSDLLEQMSKTAFAGRALGEAYQVLRAMAEDPECTIVVTLSGAMTVAKMGRVLCEMIEHGLAHVIVSTGAIMAHGLSEAIGGVHYKCDPKIPDKVLFERGYNRVFDTVEMEANLSRTEQTIRKVLADFSWSQPIGSFEIHQEIGRQLVEEDCMPSILGCAYQREVPVYVPAFTDSEFGLDVAIHSIGGSGAQAKEMDLKQLLRAVPPYNPFLDLYDYAQRVVGAKRLGIFTIGGGVPRNWAQQVGPFIDVINMRLGTELPVPRFRYGVRICPEPTHWGGLSGCTYSEGVSWGKFLSREDGGRFAEVYCDATIAWPLLIGAWLDSKKKQAAKES
jgi:deoxyhypusine synthase